MFIVFSCLGLLSCVFFCVVWFSLLVRYSQVIGWEDHTLVMSFVLKCFPYKDQIEKLFIVLVLLCVFSTRNFVNFLINFTFLTLSLI